MTSIHVTPNNEIVVFLPFIEGDITDAPGSNDWSEVRPKGSEDYAEPVAVRHETVSRDYDEDGSYTDTPKEGVGYVRFPYYLTANRTAFRTGVEVYEVDNSSGGTTVSSIWKVHSDMKWTRDNFKLEIKL